MPGNAYTKLLELAHEQYGYVTQGDALAAGLGSTLLKNMAQRGLLDRIGWGLYRFRAVPSTALDLYMEATLWPRPVTGVLSHETALDLHNLCDINPNKIHVTVPKRFRTNRVIPGIYVIFRRDLDQSEITAQEGIPIVTPERAIRDAIDTNVRPDLIEQAIDTARRLGLVNRKTLKDLSESLA